VGQCRRMPKSRRVALLKAGNTTALWDQHIAARQPCIMTNLTPDLGELRRLVSADSLRKCAVCLTRVPNCSPLAGCCEPVVTLRVAWSWPCRCRASAS
jgi:hypothetical protein